MKPITKSPQGDSKHNTTIRRQKQWPIMGNSFGFGLGDPDLVQSL